ncbi:DNA helicase-2/ATP-dependent DNA helicase PcrA [Evansella vedderi]|uniref:DNA helicase-2/ATP-dependent DNA helicase PcrA n=1 Tax=Evansella vedderi TaxID=38282 RepID=A0ABU0A0K6_9BACI|nr:RNA polymerase recycling motor HelD [Evansella vedderi]MDQ0257010.1 DNA helicase-2/ATP-dependent DNA helicase PcrA [Evansella vedderi]
MTEKNEEWQKEQQYVSFVVKEIKRRMKSIIENVGHLKEGIIGLRKTFWEDVTINLDDAHEVGETFTSIKQQAEMLSERERTHKHFYKQMKNLERLKDSPYFGRIDFLEDGEKQPETVYIGIASLMDEKDEDFLIYDWRAPISSLYYNYSPGPAQYEVPEEVIKGNIELKRQYIIRNGEMKSMFDTGVTIGDEMLQEVLSNTANTQMKSIVATIQKEQNEIIRDEKSKYLLVQGVAGSGKTSAALQRVAYLLYRYRGKMDADNIMLFSPNYLFNSYVATVLPELGEENMKQSTFQEYLQFRLGKKFTLDDPFSQLEYLHTSKQEEDYTSRIQGITFKASLKYKELLDKYVKYLSHSGLLFKDITSRGEVLFTAEDIKNYFYSLESSITIPNRVRLTAEWLLKRLAEMEKEERKKDWVLEESELLDKEDYLETYKELQKDSYNEDTFNDLEEEQALLAKKVVRRRFHPVKKRIKQLKFIDIKSLYKQLFHIELVEELGYKPLKNWKEISNLTLQYLEKNELLYEDATPFLYLTDQIEGRKTNTVIRHLFIDEAQDYSPFQLEYLKQLFPNSKMTILGDINQAIYAHSMEAPTLLSEGLYDSKETGRVTLTRSYRSTKQIVEFTKGLNPNGHFIEAFNRQGELPTLTESNYKDELHKGIVSKVHDLLKKGHETIAILCKTAAESREVYEDLKNDLDIHLMDKESHTFNKGVLLLPAYLAKGIEFDAVIIFNASNEIYGDESERKLFYTACTRAMHELHLFTLGNVTHFLDNVDQGTYCETGSSTIL